MKKLALLLFSAAVLFTSCDIRFLERTYIADPDAYVDKTHIELRQEKEGHVPVTTLDEDGTLYFIAVADPHFGREFEDSGISRSEDTFLSFIESVSRNDLTFPVLILGDLQDAGLDRDEKLSLEFIERMRASDRKHNTSGELPIIYTCGNHELEKDGVRHWEKLYGREGAGVMLTGAYEIGNTVIYNINSAYRIFGGLQLRSLEKALRSEEKDYGMHLYISHIPLASSRVDQSLFNFIIGDERERNEMQRLMRTYGPSFMLSGHHHLGNVLTEYSSSAAEFIFAAFHKRDVFFESPGRWYIYSLHEATGTCRIYGFDLHEEVTEMDPSVWKEKASEYCEFTLR